MNRMIKSAQRGLTIMELLVAMAVGMIVIIAALSMLVLGRSGYDAVDSTSQLVDRERFAVDLISRLIAQTGFEDLSANPPTTRAVVRAAGGDPEPDIFAWNNAVHTALDDLDITGSTKIVDENRPTKCGSVTDTSCRNGSDVLLIRFQGVGSPADGTMINCRGLGEPGLTTGDLNERAISMLFVHRDSNTGEPNLYCAYYNHATGAWVDRQPMLEGVESMQLLFGTDNVTPATAPAGVAEDVTYDRWLRADQLKVAGNLVATRENWRRVRAVRVGLVLRGPAASAQEFATASIAPLGSPTYVAAADVGSQLNVAADGRLRRVVNFTVHLRNIISR